MAILPPLQEEAVVAESNFTARSCSCLSTCGMEMNHWKVLCWNECSCMKELQVVCKCFAELSGFPNDLFFFFFFSFTFILWKKINFWTKQKTISSWDLFKSERSIFQRHMCVLHINAGVDMKTFSISLDGSLACWPLLNLFFLDVLIIFMKNMLAVFPSSNTILPLQREGPGIKYTSWWKGANCLQVMVFVNSMCQNWPEALERKMWRRIASARVPCVESSPWGHPNQLSGI